MLFLNIKVCFYKEFLQRSCSFFFNPLEKFHLLATFCNFGEITMKPMKHKYVPDCRDCFSKMDWQKGSLSGVVVVVISYSIF